MPGNHGGARPGAGKPKGHKLPQTLDKLQAREFVRQQVIARLTPLLEAQFAHAEGLKYLVTRERKTGKFIRVTEAMARIKLDPSNESEEVIEVWEKDPSVQAFTDLLNRALDKPAEQEQKLDVTIHGDGLESKVSKVRQRLHAVRQPKP